MIIDSFAYRKELEDLGSTCNRPRDRNLFCPSLEWIKQFGFYLDGIRDLGQPEAWDCDDFSLWAVVEASKACHAAAVHQGFGNIGHTFCFMEVNLWGPMNGIEPDTIPLAHAINVVKTNRNELLFFEPQSGQFCEANKAIRDGLVVPGFCLL